MHLVGEDRSSEGQSTSSLSFSYSTIPECESFVRAVSMAVVGGGGRVGMPQRLDGGLGSLAPLFHLCY